MSVLASRSLVCALDDEIAKTDSVSAAIRDVRMARAVIGYSCSIDKARDHHMQSRRQEAALRRITNVLHRRTVELLRSDY